MCLCDWNTETTMEGTVNFLQAPPREPDTNFSNLPLNCSCPCQNSLWKPVNEGEQFFVAVDKQYVDNIDIVEVMALEISATVHRIMGDYVIFRCDLLPSLVMWSDAGLPIAEIGTSLQYLRSWIEG